MSMRYSLLSPNSEVYSVSLPWAGSRSTSSDVVRRRVAAMVGSPTQPITKLLLAWGAGDDAALEKLIPLVYQELRRLARRYMQGERSNHTLQTTALVNEAYLRLVDSRQVRWQNRTQFFAISAQLMRRILVDFARSRRYQKRGGGAQKVTLNEESIISPRQGRDLVELDGALNALASADARKARVVELRFFGGLNVEETATVLNVSPDTVLRDWKLAKAWLAREMGRGQTGVTNDA
jgi:RNA polymerase sigma-70 factor, ECF subfamily